MQLWMTTSAWARPAADTAAQAEQDGWDGLGIGDSQNRAGDAWVAMTLAARATSTLRLATAVTNPVTRHPAVTAAAAQSLANVFGERICVGIGRGDSALAHLGKAPVGVSVLERYVTALRTYLHGGEVPFDELEFQESSLDSVDKLGLAANVGGSTLTWRQDTDPVVTVEVAASGPRVIAAAARSADRLLFAVGADTERLQWGIETARRARRDAGLDPDTLEYGAYLNVVSHPNLDTARALAAGKVSGFARFSIMHGTVNGPASQSDQTVLRAIKSTYDMRHHGRSIGGQAEVLTSDFVDRFGIVGDPDVCSARLTEIAHLGIGKAAIIGPTVGIGTDASADAMNLFVTEVIPALRTNGSA